VALAFLGVFILVVTLCLLAPLCVTVSHRAE
jgi:hypothetical protein